MSTRTDGIIAELTQIRDQYGQTGAELLRLTNGNLFPCHALYFSALNRSLEIFDGFILLAKSNNYGCCMALLRLQLDNVLRIFGVLHTKDVHAAANKIFNGAKLSALKDKNGEKLNDYYLKKLLSKENPWVTWVYDLTSAYIHLSDQHIHHMMSKSPKTENGMRQFTVGSSDDHINYEHKAQLINAFLVTTEGVFKLLPELDRLTRNYKAKDLEKTYAEDS